MIITRTPLRITLGGGGTDLLSYQEDGYCIAAAIDKYVYISVVENFAGDLLVTYSRSEHVASAEELEHPLARSCLEHVGIKTGLHISSMADIPAGTGLGSSGAYTIGLLKALYAYKRDLPEMDRLASSAVKIENLGQQDQYISAYGGIREMVFEPMRRPQVRALRVSPETERALEDNLVLFYTGQRRDAGAEIQSGHPPTAETRELGFCARKALVDGDMGEFARGLTNQWCEKYARSETGFHQAVDEWLYIGVQAGALGGKLVGAGGGGFLLYYAENKSPLREAMADLDLREVPFSFDHQGSTLVSM